jgi:hypothetical protein
MHTCFLTGPLERALAVFAVFAVFTGNYQRGSLVHRRNPGAPAKERTKEQRDNGLFGTNRLMVDMNAKSLGAWGAWQRVKTNRL